MKKLDMSNAVYPAEQPIVGRTLEFLQESWQELGNALFMGMINGNYTASSFVILYGCVNTGSGSNYIISAGAVMYNGIYFEVPAATFTASGGQTAVGSFVTTQDSADPIKMRPSGTQVSVHNVTKLVFTGAVSGTGDVDFANMVTLTKIAQQITLATQTTTSTSYVNATGLSYTTTKKAVYEIEFIGYSEPAIPTNNNGTQVEGGGYFQIWDDTNGAELDEKEHYQYFAAATTTGDMGVYGSNGKAPFMCKYIGEIESGVTIKCRFKMVSGATNESIIKAKMLIKEVGRL